MSPPLVIDLEAASIHVEVIAGSPDAPMTFLTFDDSGGRRRGLLREFHGSLADLAPMLEGLSSRGAGVFVTVHQTDGRGRKAGNIQRIRAVFLDFDLKKGATLPAIDWLLEPSLVIESGRGLHAYWILDTPIPADAVVFAGAQSALARAYRGDPKVKDLPRVMRLAGFPHQKDPKEPRPVRIRQRSGAVYALKTILAAHPLPEASPPSLALVRGHSTSTPLPGLSSDAQALVESVVCKVEQAPAGDRHNSLFWGAARLGEMHQAVGLSRPEAERRLFEAACKNGSAAERGAQESWRTIRNGFDKGAASPKEPAAREPGLKGSPQVPSEESARLAPVKSFGLTQLGNAERLAYHFGQVFRYVQTWDKAGDSRRAFLIWRKEEGRWIRDTGLLGMGRMSKAVVRFIPAEASLIKGGEEGEDKERRKIREFGRASESRSGITAMIHLAASEPQISLSHECLDAVPHLLNCPNGTVDLRTGTLQEHSPLDFLTQSTRVPFKADAVCPSWMAALRLWCGGDDEMMAYLQRFAGYCLTGEVREQSVFLLFGEGGTGKSTFIDPLVAMMGDYADYTAPTLLLQEKGSKHPTEVADLFRLRLAVAQELNEGQRWDMQRFKALSGNKRAKARRMNEDFWSFDLTHKFVIAANDRPEVSSEDGAFWRRIHTIPFRLRIPEEGRDRGMLGRFVEEWPGILAWAVQGAMDYYREGLSPCGAVEEANACYRGETDTLGSYLAEGCLTGATARVQAQHFREGYVRHCHERGLTPMGPGRLSRAVRLRACFLGQERTVDGIFYLGIGLLPVADAAS